MEVVNEVVPSTAERQGNDATRPEVPIYMVNLLKFKDRAEYEDGRETDLSGYDDQIYDERSSSCYPNTVPSSCLR